MKVVEKISSLRVATVSYLNTAPFIYGFDFAEIINTNVILTNPSKCAELLMNDDVDIALIPIGAIPSFNKLQIIKPFCISAKGNVKSVLLLSNTPLTYVTRIFLDNQSVTSNKLVEILCTERWKITPSLVNSDVYPPTILRTGDALVAIGDKAFKLKKQYSVCIDLSDEWYNLTYLPFVFAIWATKKNISSSVITSFNQTLQYGIDNIKASIDYLKPNFISIDEAYSYLTKNIQYKLTAEHISSIKLFLNYIGFEINKEFEQSLDF